jgi:hypothetical protein
LYHQLATYLGADGWSAREQTKIIKTVVREARKPVQFLLKENPSLSKMVGQYNRLDVSGALAYR